MRNTTMVNTCMICTRKSSDRYVFLKHHQMVICKKQKSHKVDQFVGFVVDLATLLKIMKMLDSKQI